MKIHNFFRTPDGQTVIFRRKHPNESLAGLPGVFALTAEIDLAIQPLHFEAANDLICVDKERLHDHPMYSDCLEFGKVGVAVCVLPKTSRAYREALAQSLNAGAGLISTAA